MASEDKVSHWSNGILSGGEKSFNIKAGKAAYGDES
jgi:hypothetical protein